ncbi:tRNA (cytidine(34)-2'-O)-methyltransferase [Flavicella sediminum]|uniref:tRNA (cytidine(34)-2'-O)-methyltransferase n=1 Tax=Flavicella sediminum TaxID=2585141 RepID=UPI001123FCAD|nr:tRNA (cytidine(34)-2'-O)-methyltransferase [Flavicella sediminum]
MKFNFNIVLVNPQIPNNTGNIGRLCVGSLSKLHLVKPLGFEITDSRVKRAGLDYWGDLDLTYHDNFENLVDEIPDMSRVFFFTTRAESTYYDVAYQEGDWLVFGREADGLANEIVERYKEQCVKIPFPGTVRSFNLGNAVAMALGEGLRQLQN